MNRKLDQLIAEKIFGAKVEFINQKAGWRVDYKADKDECNEGIWTDFGYDGYHLKYYSLNIKSAWEVILKLQDLGYSLNIFYDSHSCNKNFYVSNYMDDLAMRGSQNKSPFEIEEDNAPEAICKAALKLMDVNFE